MTYIIGIKDGPVTVTICDSRVTFEEHEGLNYALKNGRLFPGCTYAATGNAEAMRSFIATCKATLDPGRPISELWDQFQILCRAERSKGKGAYKLLIASRHKAESNFFIFDSEDSTITPAGNLVTLGSGRQLIDGFVTQLHRTRHAAILDYLARHSMNSHLAANFYCLGLMELVQGEMYQNFNRAGVGGVFHYSYQTGAEEHRQKPAIYMVVTSFPERKVNTLTCYRIAFTEGALVIEDGASNSLNISIDSATWSGALKLSRTEKDDLRNRISRAVLEQPYYNFFGIGFGQEDFRGNWLPHFCFGSDGHIIDRANIRNSIVTEFIEGIVSGNQLALIEKHSPNIHTVVVPSIPI